MKRFQKDGPKRRRWTRRETSPVSRQGYLPGTENFKVEREARRAGITGKVTKHREPFTRRGVIFIGELYPWQEWLALQILTDLSRVRASGERESESASSRDPEND